jgi:transposase
VPKKQPVVLTETQRQQLRQLVASGTAPARTLTHARLLLKADESEGGPAWSNAAIAEALEISVPTISRVRQRFGGAGLEAALHRKPPERQWERKLDGAQEAHLLALVCGPAPEGHGRWSLRLLADKMVELGHGDELSYETVRRVLKRGNSSPGGGSNGASPQKEAESLLPGWKTC